MSAPGTGVPGMARLVAVILLPFGLGFFTSYLFRSVNAVIAPNLIAELGLNATDLGFLTSVYFLTFAVMQLPMGLALDRFGPRRVQAALFLVAAAGALAFSLGRSREELAAARALIGIGVCGGLMASLKAITLWFPQARWPLVNGIFMSMGGLGAIAATEPVEWLLHWLHWRELFHGLAALSLAVSAVIFLAVPEKPRSAPPGTLADQLKGLAHIYRDTRFWRIAPVAFLVMGGGMAIQGLWAGPWLRDVGMFDRADVAHRLATLAAALAAGFFLNGVFADVMARRGVPVLTSMRIGLAALFVVEAVLVFQVDPQAYWPWLLFGLISNITAFAFPILSGLFPVDFAGRTNTALNVFVFGTAFSSQFAIGRVLDFWQPVDGRYPAIGYMVGLGGLLALQIAAFLWSLLPVSARPASSRPGT